MQPKFILRPVSKASQTAKTRVKLTQRQMGDISAKVDKQLKDRSEGVCELCSSARATERAHITSRKHLTHKTTVDDLIHACVTCHRWLDGDPAGIRYKRKLRGIDL
jgi:hypothetical protein